MDFKGLRPTPCAAIPDVLDDHCASTSSCRRGQQRRETVQSVLQGTFERYGLPERINADNGAPWGTGGVGVISTLGVWLIRLGVRLSHSRPAHPQTNGKDERFHRTMVAEVLSNRRFRGLDDAQRHFSQWRHVYNRVSCYPTRLCC
jgi:transposase InsO family protein